MSNKRRYDELDDSPEEKIKKGTTKHPLRRSRRSVYAVSLEANNAAEREQRELEAVTVEKLING